MLVSDFRYIETENFTEMSPIAVIERCYKLSRYNATSQHVNWVKTQVKRNIESGSFYLKTTKKHDK